MIRIKFKRISIGKGAKINIKSTFEGFNKVDRNSHFSGSMGLFSYIGANSMIAANIGRFCSISGDVVCLGATHPFRNWVSTHPIFYSKKNKLGMTFVYKQKFDEYPKVSGTKYPVIIGNDVYIGYGVKIIAPVKIGDGAIIGACSVVINDVPEYSVVVGVPAKIIRYRYDKTTIDKLLQFKWWNQDIDWLKENADIFENIDTFINEIDNIKL